MQLTVERRIGYFGPNAQVSNSPVALIKAT